MSKVTIVGAGPGDPKLITVLGLEAIQSADVIMYDALASESLLGYAKHTAECIYVGKRCGKHSLKQEDINALLKQKANEDKHIVRLKGGDPFVFGRGHEELVSLQKLGISIDIVPGVSSVTSLPLLQKVPLTRRGVSESFWVLTGTTKDHKISSDIIQAAQSNATSVILMGMKNLDEISKIYSAFKGPDYPVMVISKGSSVNEQVVIADLSTVVDQVAQAQLETPGIIVIGEVVRLHPEYAFHSAIKHGTYGR